MAYRVSDVHTTNVFIDQMMETRVALDKKRQEIATGYRVIDASDDPGRAGTISALQHTVQRIDRHNERIAFAVNMLDAQENALTNANEILIRSRELAQQAANESLGPEQRSAIGDEIFELRDSLAALANTKHQGVYIYGGKSDQDAPFGLVNSAPFFYTEPPDAAPAANPPQKTHWQLDPATEAGQTDTRSVDISDTETIRVLTPAGQVFEDAINSLERLGRALKGYRTGLDVNGDPDGTGTAYVFPADFNEQTTDIRSAMDALEDARANDVQVELSSVGARMNRLDQTKDILERLKTNTEQTRSAVQDVDLIQAASQFTNLQTSLEGLLATGARINSLTLLDYL